MDSIDPMNGILIIDKPAGITSHDVVARARRILGTRRVGHSGTLDPFATGVMVLLVGAATRLAQFIDKDEKDYEALVQFGAETDTGDVTGTRTAVSRMLEKDIDRVVSDVDWEEILTQFRGDISQTPPMYSAKKIEGKKLYELARKGVTVERKAVSVSISDLRLIEISGTRARITVSCSAGTYIRTLAEDIGRAVGIGAHLVELRRTRAGRYPLGDAVTLETLQQADEPSKALRPVADAVIHLPEMRLDEDRSTKTRHGLSTRSTDDTFKDGAPVRMVDEDGDLMAIGVYDAGEKIVKPKIVLV